MNSKKYLITLTAVLTAIPLLAQNQPATTPKPEHSTGSSSHFIKEAAQGNLTEIQLGQLAEQKSQNQQVKQFGQQLVADHTKANDQLKTVAQADGVQFPTTLDHKHKGELTKLEKLSGAEFDQQFARHMISDHAKDISQYNHISQTTQDTAIKQYTDACLPVLEKHLETARSVGTAVGLKPDTISSLEKHATHGMGAPGTASGTQKGSNMENTNSLQNLNK